MWGKGIKNVDFFRMCLNLKDYLFKTNLYSYRSTYMKPIATTNQKPTTDTWNIDRNTRVPLKKTIKLQGKKTKRRGINR